MKRNAGIAFLLFGLGLVGYDAFAARADHPFPGKMGAQPGLEQSADSARPQQLSTDANIGNDPIPD